MVEVKEGGAGARRLVGPPSPWGGLDCGAGRIWYAVLHHDPERC